MKIIGIGDIHGRDSWIKIVEQNPDADLFVFAGDYFDSFEIDVMVQMQNFREIIKFKKENPNKVITLIGNHDFHYTSGCIGSYSGFNHSIYYNMKLEIESLIREGVLLVAHQINKFLFTHAGVTKTFCEEQNIDTNNLVESLNDFLIYKPHVFNFKLGKNHNPYGDDINQGPLWVRPTSLLEDGLNYIHIIGHTQKMLITQSVEKDFGYILIDALNGGQYLEILIINENNTQINTKHI